MVKCLVAICLTTSCEMGTCQIDWSHGNSFNAISPMQYANLDWPCDNWISKGQCNKQFTIVFYSSCKIVIFIFGKILALSNLRNFGLIIQNWWRKIIKSISQLLNIFYNCNLFCGIDHEIHFNDLDINRWPTKGNVQIRVMILGIMTFNITTTSIMTLSVTMHIILTLKMIPSKTTICIMTISLMTLSIMTK